MKWFLIIFTLFWVFFSFCIVQSIRYRNPYKLYMIFGKKGSGKTTFMTKLAVKAMRKGKIVYSTFYIPGARIFHTSNIGRMTFPEGSIVFVDEVGMIWDNRKMNLTDWVRDWFKLQRQYKVTVWLASQAFDIDIKLRNLTDGMYMCHCKMGFLSVARKIKRDFTIVQPTGESEARIADTLEFEPILLSLFGFKTIHLTYIPKWTKFFKSFNPKPLPYMIYKEEPVPEDLEKYYYKRRSTRPYVLNQSCYNCKHIVNGLCNAPCEGYGWSAKENIKCLRAVDCDEYVFSVNMFLKKYSKKAPVDAGARIGDEN